MSNQRQVGFVINGYLEDNTDRFPNFTLTLPWSDSLGIRDPKLTACPVPLTPSAEAKTFATFDGTHVLPAFGINAWGPTALTKFPTNSLGLMPYQKRNEGVTTSTPVSAGAIANPSQFIAIVDAPLSVVILAPPSDVKPSYQSLFHPAVPYEIGFRSKEPGVGWWHDEKADVLFGDWHLEAIATSRLITNTVMSKAMWSNDGLPHKELWP